MELDNHENNEFTNYYSSQPRKKLKKDNSNDDYENNLVACNPWAVSKLEEFLSYNCPECEFKSKEKSEFYKHAIEAHSNAQNYFKLSKDFGSTDIKEINTAAVGYKQEDPNLFKDVKPNIVPSSIDHLLPNNYDDQDETNFMDFDEFIEELGSLNNIRSEISCFDTVNAIIQEDNTISEFTESGKKRHITCPYCPSIWGKDRILPNNQFLEHVLKNHNFQPFMVNGSVLKCRYCNGEVIRDIGNHEKSKCVESNSKIEKKNIFCENVGCKFESHVLKIISDHKNDCYRKCSLCDCYFGNSTKNSYKLEKLRKHYVEVHGKYVDGIILCEICAEVFYNKKQYLSHKKYKHDGVEKPRPTKTRIICELCGDNLEFKSKRKHMKMKHQDLSLRTCEICDDNDSEEALLPNRAELYKHYQKEHPKRHCPVEIDNIMVWKCKHCNDILASQTAMFNHYRLIHKLKVSYSAMSLSM